MQLDEIEQRVGAKWSAVAKARQSPLPGSFDFTDWTDWATFGSTPSDGLQFPREQFAVYPIKRATTLLLCDRLLDFAELTDEQWMTVCFLMQYGGKTRLT